MPIEPQRFIHAANLRLDVPVSVQTAESLTDELREAFEDATIDSYAYVIDQCVTRRVDYLLLTGDVFVEAERSLRARLALLRGFERLQSAGIPVVVVPGISDPPEAWRAIPEMPSNVSISYSSESEPVQLMRDDRVIATVSTSLWYGNTDSFGIQVVSSSEDQIQPFRIGMVSQAGFRETQRMGEVSRLRQSEAIGLDSANSAWMSDEGSEDEAENGTTDNQDESLSIDVLTSHDTYPTQAAGSGQRAAAEEARSWDAGFVGYVDETFREGRLNYLAMTGDLERTTLNRGQNIVHGPGTTQPRHMRESNRGTCSLIEVTPAGEIDVSAINTSSVDWKELDVQVDVLVTLSALLQEMKTRLATLPVNESDCIWSVSWTLRGPLPVLQSLQEEDLDVAVAVELDVLDVGECDIELLHTIRIVPDDWSVEDSDSLPQQYADFVTEFTPRITRQIRTLVKSNGELTKGWQQRLTSLLPSIDPERILSRVREDGAGWFVEDPSILMPEALQQLTEQPMEITDEEGHLIPMDGSESGETAAHEGSLNGDATGVYDATSVAVEIDADDQQLPGSEVESNGTEGEGSGLSESDSKPAVGENGT